MTSIPCHKERWPPPPQKKKNNNNNNNKNKIKLKELVELKGSPVLSVMWLCTASRAHTIIISLLKKQKHEHLLSTCTGMFQASVFSSFAVV